MASVAELKKDLEVIDMSNHDDLPFVVARLLARLCNAVERIADVLEEAHK